MGLIYKDVGTGIVSIEDIIFAYHSFLCKSVLLMQSFIYPRGNQKIFTSVKLFGMTTLLLLVTFFLIEIVGEVVMPSGFDTLAITGYIKSGTSLLKYIPQILIILELRSTAGYSVIVSTCDFTGGFCSLA